MLSGLRRSWASPTVELTFVADDDDRTEVGDGRHEQAREGQRSGRGDRAGAGWAGRPERRSLRYQLSRARASAICF